MSKRKKLLPIFLVFCVLLTCFPLSASADGGKKDTGGTSFALSAASPAGSISAPSVPGESVLLMEADSGKILFSRNGDERLPMASTTKIMTAYTALSLAPIDRVIRVDAAAVGVEGSSVYLTEGEELTLEQLLYALMLESANDAAVAIAVGLCGSIGAFADEMNRNAARLGLNDTHFVNPHGLDNAAHFTTASDLASLTRAALRDERFRTIVSTRKTTIPHAGIDGVRLLVNHNKLLRMYDGCIGVKTGYTTRSGRCLVSAAERDGVTLIAVTLNAPDDWNTHAALFDYGFANYESVALCEAGTPVTSLPLVGGTTGAVTLRTKDACVVTLPVGHGEIHLVTECRRFEFAPVSSDGVCGRVRFFCDADGDGTAECVGEVELIPAENVDAIPRKRSFLQWLKDLFS